uniref:Uncharacterized protein n=1 Tax=viral metagenome TaxID=1070528 RepID=A0A6M3XM24_9ZZZZ
MTKGSKMAISTAQCKKKGLKSFKKGSAGAKCRERIAKGIGRKHKIVPGKAKRNG